MTNKKSSSLCEKAMKGKIASQRKFLTLRNSNAGNVMKNEFNLLIISGFAFSAFVSRLSSLHNGIDGQAQSKVEENNVMENALTVTWHTNTHRSSHTEIKFQTIETTSFMKTWKMLQRVLENWSLISAVSSANVFSLN